MLSKTRRRVVPMLMAGLSIGSLLRQPLLANGFSTLSTPSTRTMRPQREGQHQHTAQNTNSQKSVTSFVVSPRKSVSSSPPSSPAATRTMPGRRPAAASGGATASARRFCMSCPMVGRAATRVGAVSVAALLRGGGVEHNVLAGVLAELGNVRTPAALLGGAALGTMFVPPKPGGNRRLHLLYTLLSTSAFTLQLVCVLSSTLTYTAVASQSEAIAVSAISYLSEKMQYEFFVIRGSFIYGLFSFLAALMVRGWMTFSADGDRASARMMMVVLASAAAFLLNFLHHTHNRLTLCLGGMTKQIFWLSLTRVYPTRKRLLRHIAWAACIWAAVKLLKLGPNQGNERLEFPVLFKSGTSEPPAESQ